ncbi:MAG: glycine cleavage system protein GcvH [Candidatus Nanopelagicales bacterium]|nr:glycine cleavage system protein GcvH [Candidatus Nanopelagicales bacterium]
MNPQELRYTSEHEWVRIAGEIAEIGITDYAQEALGDIVYVSLPNIGDSVAAGDACGEVESTKSVSDIYAPCTGVVTEINDALDGSPQNINEEPYLGGWLFKVKLTNPAEADGLLSAEQYEEQTRA